MSVAASPRTPAAGASIPRSATAGASSAVAQTLGLVVLGVAPVFIVVAGDPSKWKRGVIFQLVDLLLALLAAIHLPALLVEVRSNRFGVPRALVGLLCALGVSFAVHPSSMGAVTLVRFLGAVSVVHLLVAGPASFRASAARLWIVWCAVEALVVVGQKTLGRRVGLPGEVGDPFELLGNYKVPTGTSYGPHPLAAMGLVGLGLALYAAFHGLLSRRWTVVGASAGAVIVGVTCGTSSAISLATVVVAAGVAALRNQRVNPEAARRTATVLASSLLAFGLAGAASLDGWRFKAERAATTDVAAASNGRAGMIDESLAMIERFPIVGVGTGRFMATRDANPDLAALATEDQPVHNVALLIITESGAIGAFALLLIGVAVGRRVRSHALGLTVLGAMVGHALFDHAPWTFGFGMVQLALVLGFAGAREDDAPAMPIAVPASA